MGAVAHRAEGTTKTMMGLLHSDNGRDRDITATKTRSRPQGTVVLFCSSPSAVVLLTAEKALTAARTVARMRAIWVFMVQPCRCSMSR